jgi:hypothetical protein
MGFNSAFKGLMIFLPLREHINAKKYFVKGTYIEMATRN